MSMNICIFVEVPVLQLKNNEQKTVEEFFTVWQTPTDVSYEIARSGDPIKAYCDWVLSVSKDERLEIYAEDDLFAEGPVIGYETYNPGRDHIAELLQWVEMKEEVGTIKVEVL